jgi:hypothetical protein
MAKDQRVQRKYFIKNFILFSKIQPNSIIFAGTFLTVIFTYKIVKLWLQLLHTTK